ncbi:dephospho-CoA kinase [Trueperella pecoris]|uniref:Dephospho-CoA kinase n=1 Tax=Trueperella pecoris TaxID=2733571 RepID=A0A7M1R2T1_9ACTO|nr:dephospho-CoA kinase [Trueperella pecoris]QOR48642.1 dephospho-CoA kinase [Trueperella pecoris]
MLTIALTGGIGSGKSHVAAIWADLGAHVVDADRTARTVLGPGGSALEEVKRRWGGGVVKADRTLDREALAAIVFDNPREREALDAITHPAIWAAVKGEIDAALRADPGAVIVYDVPLLVGYGREFEMMANVSIAAKEEIRIERLIRNRGMSEQDARARIMSQLSDEQRAHKSDLIIVNEAGTADLHDLARAAWDDWIMPFSETLGDGVVNRELQETPGLIFRHDIEMHVDRLRYHGVRVEHEDEGLIGVGPEDALRAAGWIQTGALWRLANPAMDLTLVRRDSLSA